MNYKDRLLKMRVLMPTEKIIAAAKEKLTLPVDPYFSWRTLNYIFYRSCLENGILKISLFLSEDINNGKYTSFYDVFLDYEKRRDLVYDCRNHKWSSAVLDKLPFPGYIGYDGRRTDEYTSEEERKQVQDYVFRTPDFCGTSNIWYSIVQFQEKNRERIRRQKRERLLTQINERMALVPALPRDWEKWVEKVGADRNYIFYNAGKNVQTGYCTYCEKEGPVIKPKYDKINR